MGYRRARPGLGFSELLPTQAGFCFKEVLVGFLRDRRLTPGAGITEDVQLSILPGTTFPLGRQPSQSADQRQYPGPSFSGLHATLGLLMHLMTFNLLGVKFRGREKSEELGLEESWGWTRNSG